MVIQTLCELHRPLEPRALLQELRTYTDLTSILQLCFTLTTLYFLNNTHGIPCGFCMPILRLRDIELSWTG